MLSSSNHTEHDVTLRHRNTTTVVSSTKTSQNPNSNKVVHSQSQDTLNVDTEEAEEKSPTTNIGESSDLRFSDLSSSKKNNSRGISIENSQKYQRLSSDSSDESYSTRTTTIGDFLESRSKPSFDKMTLHRQTSPRDNGATSNIEDNTKRKAMEYVNIFIEIAVRFLLLYGTSKIEQTDSFKRIIHPEEIWLYKNPMTKDYVRASTVLIWIIVAPLLLITINFCLCRKKKDFQQAISAVTLALAMTAFLTSLLKISVGRPRPDFFYRCFPDGIAGESFEQCKGDAKVVEEGRKSFPSGHASMSFAAFGFMSFYLASKLHVFNERGRGQSWRLCISLAPMFVALEIAVSRTCDYHHHWQDVLVGSIIGICVSYLCYRQYFPSIFSKNCHRAYSPRDSTAETKTDCFVNPTVTEPNENQPLIKVCERNSKWI